MVGHGGSSAGSYLADPTSLIPSHCASIVATSTLRVKNTSVHLTAIIICQDVPFLCEFPALLALHKKSTMHQVTTMLATSKNVLLPGHNHLLTTGTHDPTLWLSPEHQRVKDDQYQWLAGGYDLEIGHF